MRILQQLDIQQQHTDSKSAVVKWIPRKVSDDRSILDGWYTSVWKTTSSISLHITIHVTFLFITDCRPHSTIHHWGPSLSDCQCSYLARFTSVPSMLVFWSRLKTHLFTMSPSSPLPCTVPAQLHFHFGN